MYIWYELLIYYLLTNSEHRAVSPSWNINIRTELNVSIYAHGFLLFRLFCCIHSMEQKVHYWSVKELNNVLYLLSIM